eukprot:scaffold3127_cov87-Skeletonema_marinoi.AAC.2
MSPPTKNYCSSSIGCTKAEKSMSEVIWNEWCEENSVLLGGGRQKLGGNFRLILMYRSPLIVSP